MIPLVRGPRPNSSRLIHFLLLILLGIPYIAQGQTVFTDEPVWSSDPAMTPTQPIKWFLGESYPNPFCSRDTSIAIPYQAPQASLINLSIVDYETGEVLRILLNQLQPPGSFIVAWDGRDFGGVPVPYGKYRFRLQALINDQVVFDSSGVAVQCCDLECLHSELATDNLDFPVTTAGDTSIAYLRLYNPAAVPVTITAAVESEGTFFFDLDFKERLAAGITLAPDSVVVAGAYFSPLHGGGYETNILFRSYDSGDTIALTTMRGSGRSITFEWVTADLYPDRTISYDDTLLILETLGDYFEADSLILYYAPGGSAEWRRRAMKRLTDDPVNDRYLGKIAGDVGSTRGISFYVVAYNGPVAVHNPPPELPERFRVRDDNVIFPAPQPPMAYRMISFPVELPGNTIVGVLDDDLGGRSEFTWRMFGFDASNQVYVEIPNETIPDLAQSRSYWLITKHAGLIDTYPEEALSAPVDSAWVIMLRPGWNMIGNPFNFPVAWDSLHVDDLTMAEAEYSLVEPPVSWTGGGEYQFDVAILEPFEGYWVHNVSDVSVIVRIPPLAAPDGSGGGSKSISTRTHGDGDGSWGINIKASSGEARDFSSVAGVDEGASNQRDAYDRSDPPMHPGDAISVYFPHATWEKHSGGYAVDIRESRGHVRIDTRLLAQTEDEVWGHAWRFDVAKNYSKDAAGDAVVLEFEGIEGIPHDCMLMLVDRYLGRAIDIGTSTEYVFFLGQKEYVSDEADARFMLLAGNEAYIRTQDLPEAPAKTALHQNYPNPFNPSTIIKYDVAKQGWVSVRVFDVTGALVKILEDREREPGRYEILWNGENEQGNRVASGVYFYRLNAPGFSQTRKLLLIK